MKCSWLDKVTLDASTWNLDPKLGKKIITSLHPFPRPIPTSPFCRLFSSLPLPHPEISCLTLDKVDGRPCGSRFTSLDRTLFVRTCDV